MWGGVIYPRFIASRYLKIVELKGSVTAPKKFGYIQIGMNDIKEFDRKYERCIWNNSGKIVFNGKIFLGQGVRVSNRGYLSFGNNVCIQANSTVMCNNSITISDNVLISWDVLIIDSDFHKIYEKGKNENQINPSRKIMIGEHTWIGCRCLILKGCKIPANSIIAANSTVTKEYETENTIISSYKILKTNVEWKA